MGALTFSVRLIPGLLALALGLAAPASLAAQGVEHWRGYISEASRTYGVPVAWIERVMHAESRGHTQQNGRRTTSSAGAMGLMQVMPGTWADLRKRYGLGSDPHDPRDNIMAGTAYLRELYDAYGYPGLFAAYNAGPGRYEEHLAGKRRLPSETRAYLDAVTGGVARSSASLTPRPVLAEVRAPSTSSETMEKPALFFALAAPGSADPAPPASSSVSAAAPRTSGLFAFEKGSNDD